LDGEGFGVVLQLLHAGSVASSSDDAQVAASAVTVRRYEPGRPLVARAAAAGQGLRLPGCQYSIAVAADAAVATTSSSMRTAMTTKLIHRTTSPPVVHEHG
jgi:hypothetical protein